MATNTFTRYAAKNIGVTASTLVTAASATQTTVIGLSIANTSAAPINVSVYFTASAVDYYIVNNATIAVGGALALFGGDGKLVLNTGDAFKVVSSAATSADAILSVLQIA